MAHPRPPSPLVQRWLAWLRGHCSVKGHAAHLRHQCFESLEQALRGCVVIEDPED
jgi:hypothetical protein